jgi:uncharacterized surface protein with fasciclin (FAS1) repeats
MRARIFGAAVAVGSGLAVAGCGVGGAASSGADPAQGQASHTAVTRAAAAAASGTVGSGTVGSGTIASGCGRSPAAGPGSIQGMAAAPVAIAAAHSRLLTDFARAIRLSGLTARVDSAKAITIFAPDDDAFAALGRGNLRTLLASRSDLTKVLEYHVVTGRQTPADLATGKHLTTLRGTVIVPAKSRGKYRVNNARVVCGDIQTANATVYIVDQVLVPIP